MRQRRAWLQEDAKPLTVCGSVAHRSGFGLGAPQRHSDFASEPAHHKVAMVHGDREKRMSAFTVTAPDPFDKRRVRRALVIKDYHASPSVSDALASLAS